jgi:hypothetical protein
MTMTVTVSLTSFLDFTTSVGSRRARIPAELRAMYEDPARHPWDYYGDLVQAVVDGFTHDDLPARTQAAVAAARAKAGDRSRRGQVKHFEALAEGALTLRHRIGRVTVVPVGSGKWVRGELAVRVSPQLGVIRRDGREEAWLLHLKDRPLTQAGADVALLVMADVLRDLGSHATPRLVDLRAGRGFMLARSRPLDKLYDYTAAEADSFSRLWAAAAA